MSGVLAVMDEFVAVVGDEFGNEAGLRLREARATVAELIAADQEYDSACLALNCETVTEDDKRNEHWAKYKTANLRRSAALARAAGGQS